MANKFNPKEFGDQIKRLRQDKKMSVVKLAELSGVNKNTICNVEKGGQRTSIETAYKIAEAFGIDPNELMNPKLIENEDYIVQNIYQEGKRRNRTKIEETSTHRIGDTNVHLKNGNLISGIVEVFKKGKKEPTSHSGEEFFFCLTGEIIVTISDVEVYLSKGDCVIFWGSKPHTYESAKNERSVGLSVISDSGTNSLSELHKIIYN